MQASPVIPLKQALSSRGMVAGRRAIPVMLFIPLFGISECSSDADLDGFSVSQGDCDDADPSTYPGAPESCDGIDHDCEGDLWEATRLYDAREEFALTSNPNGVWSYGYTDPVDAYTRPMLYPTPAVFSNGLSAWMMTYDEGYVVKNETSSSIYINNSSIAPTVLAQMPYDHHTSHIVFTAPGDAQCRVYAEFDNLDELNLFYDGPFQVVLNGEVLYSETSLAPFGLFTYQSPTLSLRRGDMLDQVVYGEDPYMARGIQVEYQITCSSACP